MRATTATFSKLANCKFDLLKILHARRMSPSTSRAAALHRIVERLLWVGSRNSSHRTTSIHSFTETIFPCLPQSPRLLWSWGELCMETGTIGRVQSPRIIRVGGGVAGETAEVLRQLGLSCPLIVTDPTLYHLGRASGAIRSFLGDSFVWRDYRRRGGSSHTHSYSRSADARYRLVMMDIEFGQ
jgi:hypothetical protein